MKSPPPSRQIAVRNPDTVSAWIRRMNTVHGITFRQIKQKPYFRHLPVGTICAVMHGAPVPNKYREAMGLPLIVKVPADMVRKTKPVAANPRQLTRCTIYPGTPIDKIIADVYRVTGITVAVVDGELEY